MRKTFLSILLFSIFTYAEEPVNTSSDSSFSIKCASYDSYISNSKLYYRKLFDSDNPIVLNNYSKSKNYAFLSEGFAGVGGFLLIGFLWTSYILHTKGQDPPYWMLYSSGASFSIALPLHIISYQHFRTAVIDYFSDKKN